MKHLFCISSPFQADSARRIIEHYEIPLNNVIVLLFDNSFGRDKNRVAMSLDYIIGKADVREIRYKTNSFFRRLKFVFNEGADSSFIVYVGDWRNKLPKYFALHPGLRGFRSIDDGTASFVIAEKVQKSIFFYKLFKRLYPRFISRYKLAELYPSLDVDTLPAKNNIGKKFIKNKVLFIGCCVVEKGIMREAEYQYILNKIQEKLPDHEWVYYPHRSEELRPLPESFLRLESDIPIEHWFESLSEPPGIIVSLFSSALINLKTDHPGLCAYYFEPNISSINSRKDDVEHVYAVLRGLSDYQKIN